MPTELARQIRRVRATHTQSDFAAELGVRRATVIAWESGASVPGPRAAHLLVARGLDLDTWLDATRPQSDTATA
jgi:DNA-binding transcriptional regulator YiaG